MYRNFRVIGIVIAIGLTASLVTACEEFQGVPAPHDSLFFPVGLALHPDGRYLYVVSSNFDVAYRHDLGGTVTVIDTDTMELVSETTVLIGSFGAEAVLSADARYLFVAVRGDNSIVRLDVSEDGRSLSCEGGEDGRPCRITGLPADPFALVVETIEADLEVGGETRIDLIVVTHLNSNMVTALSMMNADLTTVTQIHEDVVGGGSSVAINPRTGIFYATGRFDDRVRSFRPVVGREGEIAAIYPLTSITLANPAGDYDSRGIAFSADGNRAFVSARRPSSLLVLDTSAEDLETGGGSRDEVIDQIDLLTSPEALTVFDDDGVETLYVLEFDGDLMTVIDPANRLIIDDFPVGDGPSGLVVDTERHQRIYVSLFREDAIGVVDIDPTSRRYRSLVAKIR